MNTINNPIQNALLSSLYNNTTTVQEQNKINQQQQNSSTINTKEDVLQLSNESDSTNLLRKSLTVLVQNGTITQDQVTAIEDAFKSNTNSLGTYSRKPTDPFGNLVKNGVISQDQATSIKGSLKRHQDQQVAMQKVLTAKMQAFNSGADDDGWL